MLAMRPPNILAFTCLWLAATLASACSGKPVDLKKDLEVTEVITGWFDAGIVGGKNKLVPSISFRLKNVSSQPIVSMQVMLSFRQVSDKDVEWGSAYAKGIGPEGLAPGAVTAPIVLRSERGYTSEAPRAQMLQHRQFVDTNVQLFGKYGSQTWVKLGEYLVKRILLTE
jgi:hypothetical protein